MPLQDTRTKMTKTIDALHQYLASIRTGRANPEILSRIQVEYYGSMVPIKQVANITVPDNMTLMLTVFDRSAIKALEKAIQSSDLGLNPQTDGASIRLRFPDLTQERRKDLVKLIRKQAEESKIALRNIRRDALDFLKTQEKTKAITEDDCKKHQEDLQKITDSFSKLIDQTIDKKESEIMTL